MKKIAFIVFLGLSLALHAQRGQGHKQERSKYTPEQEAVLKTKKMALQLDLSEDQQDKLIAVNKRWSETRAKKRDEFRSQYEGEERPDSDARFKHQSEMLDDQIAYHKEVERILNKEQYAMWKEQQEKRNRGHACRQGKRMRHGERRES